MYFWKNVLSGAEILEVPRFHCEITYVGEIIIKRRRVQKGQLFLIIGDYCKLNRGGGKFVAHDTTLRWFVPKPNYPHFELSEK